MMHEIKNKLKSFLKAIFFENNTFYLSQFAYCKKFWNRFPFNLDIVNLGSNTGLYSFRYEGFNIKGANWALSPQSFNQDLAILKTYCSFIRPRGTVIVPLGPYSSCLKNYTDTEWLKYFTILHPGVTENFNIEKQRHAYELKNHPYRVATKQMMIGLIGSFKFYLKRGKRPENYNICPLTDVQIEQSANVAIDAWKKQFKIENMDAPLPEHIKEGRKQRVATLKEMIQFCKEREFQMYVVLPPVTKSLSKQFSVTFRENYIYSFLREAGLPEKQFLNYLDDEELQKNKYFFNSLFLNKKGGHLFTKKVLMNLGLLTQQEVDFD